MENIESEYMPSETFQLEKNSFLTTGWLLTVVNDCIVLGYSLIFFFYFLSILIYLVKFVLTFSTTKITCRYGPTDALKYVSVERDA